MHMLPHFPHSSRHRQRLTASLVALFISAAVLAGGRSGQDGRRPYYWIATPTTKNSWRKPTPPRSSCVKRPCARPSPRTGLAPRHLGRQPLVPRRPLPEREDGRGQRPPAQAGKRYIDMNRKHGSIPGTNPGGSRNSPWTFFSITDYVRTLCLFHAKSPHFPGRLKPETEAAMKEALWLWVRGESRLADAGPDDLFLLLGTENHDLNRRPNYYLVTALLNDDPAYRDRKLADGHTVAEHAAAYTAFFREWPRSRAKTGSGSRSARTPIRNTPGRPFSTCTSSRPIPSSATLRPAARSRLHRGGADFGAGPPRRGTKPGRLGANAFESYKNLLFASEGQPAGSSHSRVIETSRYQLPARGDSPAQAGLSGDRALRHPQPGPRRTRKAQSEDEAGQRLAADSALVNYAYRTPIISSAAPSRIRPSPCPIQNRRADPQVCRHLPPEARVRPALR